MKFSIELDTKEILIVAGVVLVIFGFATLGEKLLTRYDSHEVIIDPTFSPSPIQYNLPLNRTQ